MDEQFLMQSYEYYRQGNANNPNPLTYEQYKAKVTGQTSNKFGWIPYVVAGFVIAKILK